MTTFTKQYVIPIESAAAPLDQAVIKIGPLEVAGDGSAHRRLTFPNDALPILDYDTNPIFQEGFENQVLVHPIAEHLRMLEGSLVDRSEGDLTDFPVTEVWPADPTGASVSMKKLFFRSLLDYITNPTPSGQRIIWEPRDITPAKFEIEFIDYAAPQRIRNDRVLEEYLVGEYSHTFMVKKILP